MLIVQRLNQLEGILNVLVGTVLIQGYVVILGVKDHVKDAMLKVIVKIYHMANLPINRLVVFLIAHA